VANFKRRLLIVLKYSVYPLFYLTCLLVFFYLTFPWDSLKDRLIAEFAATQAAKGSEAQRLEIGSLSGYWVTGIEIQNAKLIIPPSAEELAAHDLAVRKEANESLQAIARGEKSIDDLPGGDDAADEDADATGKKTGKGKDDEDKGDDKDKADKKPAVARGPRETVLLVERATARLQILPLLIGRFRLAFDVEAFGGEIRGSVPLKGKGDVEVSIDHVDLAQIPLVKKALTIPLRGIVTAELALSREDGKTSKSSGSLTVTIEDAVLGDGKSKLANMITLPAAKLGKVEITAEAEKGLLKLSKLAANGDVELSGEGTVKLKEKWRSSALDLFMRVKLSDDYRNKDDKTKLIFGEPGSKMPGMIDTQPKLKRAKRDDDSYGLHVFGSLKAPKYEPWTGDEPTSGVGAKKKEKSADKEEALADPFKRSKTPARTPPKPPKPPMGNNAANNAADDRRDRNRNRPEPAEAQEPEGLEAQEPEGPPGEEEAPPDSAGDDQAAPGAEDQVQ
jgi:type II secretion system protein N